MKIYPPIFHEGSHGENQLGNSNTWAEVGGNNNALFPLHLEQLLVS